MKKKVVAMLMSTLMAFSLAACGSSSGSAGTTDTPAPKTEEAQTTADKTEESAAPDESRPEETVVIRYGTHWVNDLDPNHTDEVTGEYTMSETRRDAALTALQAIKDQLNVEFEFVQYSGDVRNDLMTSVLAGNPVCDIAHIWGGAEGTILGQNVLQQLDQYEDLFADEESSWMWDDKLYGHNYLLCSNIIYKQRWPLIFNISMIEKVDTLPKNDDGSVKLPMQIFLDGDWTWSTFTDYLTKIQAYYSNTAAPEGCYADTVQAYETDHRFAGLSAMYSAGGMIYGSKGLYPDGDESIKGAQYIEELMQKKLLTDPGVYDDGYTPRWCEAADHFQKGGTVFTDSPDWWIGGNGSALAERNESMGIVPWPRPDDMAFDDENYKQVSTIGESDGILKGVDPEKTELALKAYKLYWQEFYKALGGTETVAEYKESNSLNELAGMNIDVTNEVYGDQLAECFDYIGSHLAGDYADLLGIRVAWDDILGKSLYGMDGMSSYDVSVKANKATFTNVISDMEAILASNDVKDNQKPSIEKKLAPVSVGSKFDEVDWTQFFTAEDAVDGVLDPSTATIELEKSEDGKEILDLDTVGLYEKAVKIAIKDAAGNEETGRLNVAVYNPDNTAEPVITAKAELPTVTVDTDASGINWKDFIESAVDADGIDISESITADLSNLDTTKAGDYDVDLTATDYVGNTTTATITVTVAAAE